MSTVSGISSGSNSYQNVMQSNWKQRQQDFQDIITDIQSSNLTAAQQAFTSLQQNIQNMQNSGQVHHHHHHHHYSQNATASAGSDGSTTSTTDGTTTSSISTTA